MPPSYRLQPVIGSTVPFSGWLRVMITATGHVTIRTRDKRTARIGTRKMPRKIHCMEGGAHTHTYTHTHIHTHTHTHIYIHTHTLSLFVLHKQIWSKPPWRRLQALVTKAARVCV